MKFVAKLTMISAAVAMSMGTSAFAQDKVAVFATVTAKIDGYTGRPRPMGGSTTYIPIVNRGEVDFGFTNALEAHHAVAGLGSFKDRKQSNLRMIGKMFPLAAGIAVAADTGI